MVLQTIAPEVAPLVARGFLAPPLTATPPTDTDAPSGGAVKGRIPQ
jgi:hypothetical protein